MTCFPVRLDSRAERLIGRNTLRGLSKVRGYVGVALTLMLLVAAPEVGVYGVAELMSDDQHLLDKINGLLNEVHSQIGLAEHLSEVLASGLEVLQSIYNNQLQIINNRLSFLMGILTIIGTALLVPNTIATVMSQTSIFALTPADMWWYLALLAGSTVVATTFAWWAVKRMGFLPKHPDED